ncbi:hypothetical protein [Streptomyces sp. NPDC001770]
MRSSRIHQPPMRPRAGRAVSALCALAALGTGLFAIPTAQAAPASRALVADLACPAGNQNVSFSPGVTLTPRTVSVTYDLALGVCVSLAQPGITGGTSGGTVSLTLDCLDLLGTSMTTQTFLWSDGQTSTLSFTRTVTIINGQTVLTLTGPVSAGVFSGRSAVLTVVEPALDVLACESTLGLRSQAGVTTLIIT